MDSYKETMLSRHSRTNVRADSWRLWQQAEDLHRFKPDRVPDLERGRYKQYPIRQLRNFLQCTPTSKGIDQLARKECHLVYQTHSRAGPMLRIAGFLSLLNSQGKVSALSAHFCPTTQDNQM